MLSRRLMCIAQQVQPLGVMADIGTDHGYLPIYLVKNNIVKTAIAADISKGACRKAELNIKSAGLQDKISVRCGDGLTPITIEDNVDCIVMAGMGGMLAIHILESNRSVTEKAGQIILQPQKDIYAVRKYIHTIGLKIVNEECLHEEGKFYNIINAVHGTDRSYSETEYYLGRFNIERKQQAYIDFLNAEIKRLDGIIENMIKGNADELRISELIQLKNIYMEGLK